MGDKPILQFDDNILNFDVFVKDIVVALVDVVVQKVDKDLSVVANPIDDIGIVSRSQDDIFLDVFVGDVHESKDLLQENDPLPITDKRVPKCLL